MTEENTRYGAVDRERVLGLPGWAAIGVLSAGLLLLLLLLALGRDGREGATAGGAALRVEPYAFLPAVEHVQTGSPRIGIRTLSSRNDMVSGGDVLLQLRFDEGLDPETATVERNGEDVTILFRPTPAGDGLLGFVDGLEVGDNLFRVRTAGPTREVADLVVTNHPGWGPVFAGPHEEPYFCTTHLFRPAVGETLGAPLDEHCSVERRVDYVYRSLEGEIEPYPTEEGSRLPEDVTWTMTMDGREVPFIVRVETGTANRAIYELAILHDPRDPPPDPWTPSPGWNGRLVYRFGGGCRPGWYQQGSATAGVLDDVMLSRGYAVASASLNVFANNCSELLAAETMMMVKERFIEVYGPPAFTIGWGASGGSHQQFGIADNYPGLLDGLVVGLSFPDMTSGTVFKSVDGRLLERYFAEAYPGRFTEEQERAVAGFGVRGSIPAMSVMARRSDPMADFAAVVPEEVRYHPVINPAGARATIYDHTVNVYGRDPATGFARRPLDNVGVQYGLQALQDGIIDLEQFLELNEGIGGLDIDFRHQTERTTGDPGAISAAYRTGRIISGRGLASVPIVDFRPYLDMVEAGDNHMKLHSFSLRERLVREQGHAVNHVILVTDQTQRGGFGSAYSSTQRNEVLHGALAQLDRWLTAVSQDTSGDPLPERVLRARPHDLVDACWTEDGRRIEEEQTYDGPGECGRLYPSFPVPLMVAGAPLVDDIVKCHLRPLDPDDYPVPLAREEWDRLEVIFPEGVCDWSRPGIGQEPQVGFWLRAVDR